mmetsp:Transcript_10382/g.17847  ORF Transcript_10382/g.17847 Transcript_10382/m.17847 type:complete len:234 (-) Transcript_10382:132-833(-)|eukprot:CAMPEP_0198202720 /NCGR_PEP_ID=MMETSP1445-20131203/5923_1 /TAXON_ID=36898 /ORGANISM="Pyramimonas sp., Strain CCMP2087" /LENGTH=233 /DNA_ID=CAMNT_0043873779 /DNA_START=281 /DNA_END=982 /DNA_ORIENTATION=-
MGDSSDDDEATKQLQYKVIILGDGAVGKTSLATRFTEDSFSKSYKQTIGVDFFIKQIMLPNDVHVAIQVWDIGGQTIGGKMIGNYIYGAHAVLLVYDISSYQSFANLEDWFALVKRTFDADYMPYIALVANKADLTHLRTVKQNSHHDFADENRMHSFFASAKTGDNVAEAFHRIVMDLAGMGLVSENKEHRVKPSNVSLMTTSTAHGSVANVIGRAPISEPPKVSKTKCSIQ